MGNWNFIGGSDPASIDEMYHQYKLDASKLDKSWQLFFEGFEFARFNFATDEVYSQALDKEFSVINLIEGYRRRGHLFTKTNPVRVRRKYSPTLDIENFGLSPSDLDSVFQAGKEIGIGAASLRLIIEHVQQTYCQSVGVEYQYIREPNKVDWLQEQMEKCRNTPNFSGEQKIEIYRHLKKACGFEIFVHKHFVGQKRFSLEGGETLIPALDAIIEYGSKLGVSELIIGMAHRGRLNVLANILQKPYEDIFREFMGREYDEDAIQGDVKYHLGFENVVATAGGGKMKLKLVPNPSHLETVGAVVQGLAHARIRYEYEKNQQKLVPVIIHGDAAIAAQGVVYETIQMSQLNGYQTGGTIHLVVNNQVGFTTNYLEARSSTYCTDVGKIVRAPIFHVNGDDAEALVYTVQLAMEYRQKFSTDVFVDILCYRKYGHNEGDEPRFTQPVLYDIISKHPNPRDIYSTKLEAEGVFNTGLSKQEEIEFDAYLENCLHIAQADPKVRVQEFLKEKWQGLKHSTNADFEASPQTGVEKNNLLQLAEKINYLPLESKFFAKAFKIVDERKAMVLNNKLDWGMCELLAYGSLLLEGFPVRISGQDCERGTFSHRHAAFVIEDSTKKYFPLQHVSPDQPKFHAFNSPLSEYAVLGFEYGYSLATPHGLNIWEAQFGDFHNVAQVIIDQYISSAEEKWNLKNGLVLFLPHGFEGQGPEHSSARIERFLILAAHNNMQIVNCSTPANLFHLLRRQMHRSIRVPLVVFTPKSLLRHPKCTSTIDELSVGEFKEVFDDNAVHPQEVKKLVFTSGKIYYDLIEKRDELALKDVAIVRIEQLYPFPVKQITELLNKYSAAEIYLWVQEEPVNMGPWIYISRQDVMKNLLLVSRPQSGSPATGYFEVHKRQLKKILDKTFGQCNCKNAQSFCGMKCEGEKPD